MYEVNYQRETPDGLFRAWYVESDYYGHHYRFYSFSPWHTAGSGTRFATEAAARAAVDSFMDAWVPSVLHAHGKLLCPMCGRVCLGAECQVCEGCKRRGCPACVNNPFVEGFEYDVCQACLQEWDEMERRYGGL